MEITNLRFHLRPPLPYSSLRSPENIRLRIHVLSFHVAPCCFVGMLEMAVKCLSNEKSTGIDEIPIELFKASPEAIQELHNLIASFWGKETFPEAWYQGLFVNIYKNKGNKTILRTIDQVAYYPTLTSPFYHSVETNTIFWSYLRSLRSLQYSQYDDGTRYS